jgi:hypothetical protein
LTEDGGSRIEPGEVDEPSVGDRLLRTYVKGWMERDTVKILGTLDPECVVVESHGPVYHSVHNPNWSLGRHAEGGEDRLAAVHPDLLDQQPHQRLAGGRIAIGVEEADDVGADVVERDEAGGRLVLHRGHQLLTAAAQAAHLGAQLGDAGAADRLGKGSRLEGVLLLEPVRGDGQ